MSTPFGFVQVKRCSFLEPLKAVVSVSSHKPEDKNKEFKNFFKNQSKIWVFESLTDMIILSKHRMEKIT